MYRVLNTQKCNIYCEEDRCNLECGYFHKPDLKQTTEKSLRDRRLKLRVQSLDISGGNNPIGINGEKKAKTGSAGSERKPQISYLNIQEPNAIEPITPLTVSGSSTVTLDEIIASAKRKISQELVDLRIPSPTLIEGVESEMKHLGKQRNLIGATPWPKDIYQSDEDDHKGDISYVEHLVDSSDDDLWYNQDPPSIIENGDQEDFDELLKATQPPSDHYSNPLYRKADKLTRRHKKNIDFDDNSSVSLSLADISESQLDFDLNFALIQTRLTADEKVEYEGNL